MKPQFLAAACLALWAGSPFAASAAQNASPPGAPTVRKAAIFVENRAGVALNDKVAVLEDFLTSRVTGKGFSIISREVTVEAMKRITLVTEVDRSRQISGGNAKTSETLKEKDYVISAPSELDRKLSDHSTALRLAQNLGADYLLVASIASFGTETRTFTDGDFKTKNVIHTLRVSYKVLEGVQGGSVIAETVTRTKTTRFTENSQTENSDIVNGLLEEASTLVAGDVAKKVYSLPPPAAGPALVEITVSCGMQDLVQFSLPDVRVLDNGTLVVTTNRLAMQVLNATVEVDGISIGNAPGKFKVRPGLSKMKITREGFKPYERTVNFSEGQTFDNVALQMSEAGYARFKDNVALWKDQIAFLFALKTGEKLTDGTVKMMEGFAQTLRQSGYRVDARTDSKVNIEHKGKSLFDGAQFTTSLFGNDKEKDK